MADLNLYETISYLKEQEKNNRKNMQTVIRLLQEKGIIQAGEVKLKKAKKMHN